MFNPLLFADWGKLHRGFRSLMWIVAVLIVYVVLLSQAAQSGPHATPAGARHVVVGR